MDTIGPILIAIIFLCIIAGFLLNIFGAFSDLFSKSNEFKLKKQSLDQRDKMANLLQRELDLQIKEKALLDRENIQKKQ